MASLPLLLAALAMVRADPSPAPAPQPAPKPAAQLEFDPNFVDLGNLPGRPTSPRPPTQSGGFENRQFDEGGRAPLDNRQFDGRSFSQQPFGSPQQFSPSPYNSGNQQFSQSPFNGGSQQFSQQPFNGGVQQPLDAAGRPLGGGRPYDVASGGRFQDNNYRGAAGRSFDGPRVPQTVFGDVGQDQINGPSPALPGAPRPASSYPGNRDRYNGPGLNGDAPFLRPLGPPGFNGNPDGFPGPSVPPVPPPNYIPEGELRELLARVDSLTSQQCTHTVAAQWAFETNVNAVTQVSALEAQLQNSELQRAVRETLNQVDLNLVENPDLARQIRLLSVIGPSALPPDQLDRYNGLINSMLAVYNSATICAHREPLRCGLRLDPDLTLIMARSRDWDELQYVWLEWRRRSGFKIRDLFDQLVDLSNMAAKQNNLTSFADYWLFPYETPDFRLQLETAWEEVRPLYEQLHAYVRRKLRDFYGPDKISRQAPLPAHILGNMWAQSWSNILDITIPYPGKNFLDVGPQMASQGYTPAAMFRLAEEFYTSMNMSAMPAEFWSHSVIEEPPARVVVCQPSAWDFCNRKDYRIKMCTHVNMMDLVTAHHEMAHVQYFMEYKKLPKIYRDGANPGLHEAVGEAISLSVATPRHLQALGLVQTAVDDVPHNINYLFALALDKLPFLPFSLALDKWRWDVFQKRKTKDQYNCHYWFLRERYGGIKPPFLRSEFDFDPGAKFHVPANIPYIKYFVATILQFQIHKAMCRAAGQYDPENDDMQLHKCDIYRSKEAGNILKRLMEQGSSVPWTDALYAATGESRLNGSALREYFRPLEEWLQNENLRTNEFAGWTYDGDYCKRSIETAGLEVYGGFYNAGPGGVHQATLHVAALLLPTLVLLWLSTPQVLRR